MPPAIQSTMTVSAVGLIFGSSAARSCRGQPAASAESVAAPAVRRKSRRLQELFAFIITFSIDQLKLRQHRQSPQQILDAGGLGGLADDLPGQFQLLRGWLSAQRPRIK